MSSTQIDVVDYITDLNSFFVMGIGNIVGWGDDFLNHLKKYRINE